MLNITLVNRCGYTTASRRLHQSARYAVEETERTPTSCEGEIEQDRTTYPTEDIGTVEGKTLENLSFTNTDSNNFSLGTDIFADEQEATFTGDCSRMVYSMSGRATCA